MFLSTKFGFFGGSGGVVTPLPGGFAVADIPGNGTATAGWRFNSDGTVDRRNEFGWTLGLHNWYSPTTPAIGASYYLRATQITGNPIDAGTFGTWQLMSGSLLYQDTVTGGGANLSKLLIEISTDGTDSGIVTDSDPADYNIDVLSEP